MKYTQIQDCVVETTTQQCPHCHWSLLHVYPTSGDLTINNSYVCPNESCNFVGNINCSVINVFRNMLHQNKMKVFDFQANIRFGKGPLTVNFTETSLNTDLLAHWTWNFGDGTGEQITTTNAVSHQFQSPGSYTVTLTVFENAIGNHIITKQNMVLVY